VRHHGFSHSSLYKVTSEQAPRNLLIEHLWQKVKKEATHLKHFPAFTDLQHEGDRALLHFAQTPREITVLMARYCEKLGQVDKAA